MAIELEIERAQSAEMCEEIAAVQQSPFEIPSNVKVLDTFWVRGGGARQGSERKVRAKSSAPSGAGTSKVRQGSAASPQSIASDSGRQSGVRYVKQAELDAELARLQRLSAAASNGDTAALDELRIALDGCPHVWRRIGDLQYSVECKMAQQLAEKDILKLEALRKRSSELRHELADGSGSIVVQMAASRFVAAWLFAQFLELRTLSEDPPNRCIKALLQAERRVATAMRALLLAKTAEIQQRRLEGQCRSSL